MTATLILIFCLSADPTHCVERQPGIDGLTYIACVTSAQSIALDDPFMRLHPEYRLARWRCRLGTARREGAA